LGETEKVINALKASEPEIVKVARLEFEKCMEILKNRDKKYGDSWKWITEAGIKEIMHDKLRRTDSPTIPVEEKIEQLRDVANYAFIEIALINRNRVTTEIAAGVPP
jgi:hypothetical protein